MGVSCMKVNIRFLSQETELLYHLPFPAVVVGWHNQGQSVTLQMHPLLLQGVWESICQCLSMPENTSPIELLCKRNPAPGPAIHEDIDLHLLEEAQLLCFGMHLVLANLVGLQ